MQIIISDMHDVHNYYIYSSKEEEKKKRRRRGFGFLPLLISPSPSSLPISSPYFDLLGLSFREVMDREGQTRTRTDARTDTRIDTRSHTRSHTWARHPITYHLSPSPITITIATVIQPHQRHEQQHKQQHKQQCKRLTETQAPLVGEKDSCHCCG